MQGIDKAIAVNFGLETRSIFPYKNMYVVVTSSGKKLLKRIPFSAERIKFVYGAKEHLVNNGFTNVDRYLCTLSGEPFFVHDNCRYTLVDYPDGHESSFDNDDDIRLAAVLLARLHAASRGYLAPEGCKVQNELGKLPGYFEKRLDDIKKMRKQSRKGKTRFDELFSQYSDYFIEQGARTVDALASSSYCRLVEKTGEEASFCHHDYTHHNIYIDGINATAINFDYCCYELRIYDVANFIRRKMRKCDWDISKTELILDCYNSVEPLSSDELSVMGIILQFPQKFWRVANRYYNSRRSWSEQSFVSRLQNVIDEIGPFERFIKRYQSSF